MARAPGARCCSACSGDLWVALHLASSRCDRAVDSAARSGLPNPPTPHERRSLRSFGGCCATTSLGRAHRDLRDRFDCGGSSKQYEVSLYRGEVDDWTIIDRVLDRSWKAIERVPIELRSAGPFGRPRSIGGTLGPGDVVWAGEWGRHRSSVGCLLEASSKWSNEMAEGAEIVVPLPEFGRRLRMV